MSRNIADLQPEMQDLAIEFKKEFEKASGYDLLIYCTLRTHQEQAVNFRRGRKLQDIIAKADELKNKWGREDLAHVLLDVGPQHGPQKVTNAGPGQSLHEYGYAFDAVPVRDKQLLWSVYNNKDTWDLFGEVADRVGLAWGGDWKDYVHLEYPDVYWSELIRSANEDTSP